MKDVMKHSYDPPIRTAGYLAVEGVTDDCWAYRVGEVNADLTNWRSASRSQLIVPRVRRSTFGARAFAIAGPPVWNSLPDSLRDPAVGPDQFRRDLKTHLFE